MRLQIKGTRIKESKNKSPHKTAKSRLKKIRETKYILRPIDCSDSICDYGWIQWILIVAVPIHEYFITINHIDSSIFFHCV